MHKFYLKNVYDVRQSFLQMEKIANFSENFVLDTNSTALSEKLQIKKVFYRNLVVLRLRHNYVSWL